MLKSGEVDTSPVSDSVLSSAEPDPSPASTPRVKVSTSGRLFPFCENGLWGYKNSKGQVAIDCIFSAAFEFESSVAFAALDGLFGLISRNGVWIAEPQWSDVLPFSENKAAVKSSSDWGYIDIDGNLIIDYQFDEAGSFCCGRALVKDSSLGSDYGYIDINGTLAASAKWRKANVFSEDKAFVSSGSTSYIVNKLGDPICTLQSDESGYTFSEGFALIKDDDDYYFMNSKFRQAFDESYDDALPFSSSLAAVKTEDGLWGYINTSGVMVIAPSFSLAKSFSTTNTLAAVRDNETGLWGYINKSGKIVIACEYDDADTFKDDYAIVKSGTSYYIINTDGNTVFLY